MNSILGEEMKNHLKDCLIPFWKRMRDQKFGGYYGFMDFELKVDREAVKGTILNSRIIWFFSNAYLMFKDPTLLEEAEHGYEFFKTKAWDEVNGGVFWSLNYDGTPADVTKHTYNQAFCIYALAAYYEASGCKEALEYAWKLFDLVEEKCKDKKGYLEAFSVDFKPESNEKLSENGVMATRTMNTLLHVLEAYTQLYKVTKSAGVRKQIVWILEIFGKKVYNPMLRRQEVFFDDDYHSLINLHSFGHDIEAAWLIDRALEVIDDDCLTTVMRPLTKVLTEQIYVEAFDGRSLPNESENGIVDENRIWWVQAEAVVGFLNGYQMNKDDKYLEAAGEEWRFIKSRLWDKRDGGEWFWMVNKDGQPVETEPIVEEWKCPYHNGRMCFEVINRLEKAV